MALAGVLPLSAVGQESRPPPWPGADRPAFPHSPYRGAVDGNGKAIPCRCRFQGRSFELGAVVCMATHLGVVLTRCDLLDNTTSWVPTGTACTISLGPETEISRAARWAGRAARNGRSDRGVVSAARAAWRD